MPTGQGYIGREPGDSSVTIAKQHFQPTGVQTDFTFSSGYDPGYCDVYLNGSRLVNLRDYTATNGSTVGLITAANSGDIVEIIAQKAFNVSNVNSTSGNFSVGNNLTVDNLSSLVDVNVSGTVTATAFSGDGSALTGVASTDYIITGTAATFNSQVKIYNLNVTGITTSQDIRVGNGLTVVGAAQFDGNVTIGGTLTYEDVTNVDSVGLVTAQTGVRVTAGGLVVTAGVSTLTDDVKVNSTLSANEGLHVTAGVTTIAGNQTVAGTSSFAKKTTVNATLDATEGLHVSAGVATFAGNQTVAGTAAFAQKTTVNATLDATEGLHVSAGVATFAGVINAPTFDTNGDGVVVTGIVTASVGCDFNGYKVEEGSYDTDALNGEFDFLLEDGHVQTHTGSTAGTYFPDFKVSSGVSLNEVMGVGDVVSATLIVTASNTSHYCTGGTKIDNSTSNVTVEWIGSEAPTEGKGAGYDIYAFTIQKTAATPAYLVIVNATNAG